MSEHAQLNKQIIFFLFVGGATFFIDFGVTYALFHFLNIHAYIASAAGFLSGFLFNFPMNRKQVFHHSLHDRFSLKTQVIFYATLSLFNLGATSLVVQVIVNWGGTILLAKVLVTGFIAIWNFLIFKFLIFSKKYS